MQTVHYHIFFLTAVSRGRVWHSITTSQEIYHINDPEATSFFKEAAQLSK